MIMIQKFQWTSHVCVMSTGTHTRFEISSSFLPAWRNPVDTINAIVVLPIPPFWLLS
jgi:hypothetical protein